MKIAHGLCGIAAAAAAFLAESALPAPSSRHLTSLWDIQSSGTWTEPHALAKGDVLIAPAILPKGLIELTEDVSGDNVDGLLRKGDLLYRLSSGAGQVYCTLDGQPMINNEAKFAHTMLICLVDADSDGTFEGHFRKPAAAGVPIIFGAVPTKLRQLGAVRYETRPPSAAAGRYAMRIVLDSDPAKARQLKFTYAAGDPEGKEASTIKLSAVAEVRNGSYPQVFEALGGLFELTGVQDGKAVIRMVSPTELYPFMVEPGTVRL